MKLICWNCKEVAVERHMKMIDGKNRVACSTECMSEIQKTLAEKNKRQ